MQPINSLKVSNLAVRLSRALIKIVQRNGNTTMNRTAALSKRPGRPALLSAESPAVHIPFVKSYRNCLVPTAKSLSLAFSEQASQPPDWETVMRYC
ncbi:hypothetical protein VTP01DRAFT_5180, partial [Rhizomucor pusillus]|uniref:uncharacterized protein n=1 Tax=Rhizomucor pusillus TaxID=4840 RepID=UPI0037444008